MKNKNLVKIPHKHKNVYKHFKRDNGKKLKQSLLSESFN